MAKNEKGEAISKTVEVKDIPADEAKPEKQKSPEKTVEQPKEKEKTTAVAVEKKESQVEEAKADKAKSTEKTKEEPSSKEKVKTKKVEGSKLTLAKPLQNMVI